MPNLAFDLTFGVTWVNEGIENDGEIEVTVTADVVRNHGEIEVVIEDCIYQDYFTKQVHPYELSDRQEAIAIERATELFLEGY